MSYIINKTDGSRLTEIVDGTIDQTSTDITLIGKNASSYGENLNENFIRILENFANTSPPNNPIPGQLWFDTTESRLKVYDNTSWKVSGGSIVANSPPSSFGQGDIWIDSLRQQLYFNDGVSTKLAGPAWSAQQGITGFEIVDITDINSNARTVILFKVGGVLLGIFSSIGFTPNVEQNPLLGWQGSDFNVLTTYIRGDRVTYRSNPNNPPTLVYEATTITVPVGTLPTDLGYWKQITISPGFNSGTLSNLKFDVTSTAAMALVGTNGDLKTATNFLAADGDSNSTGTLSISNATPLILGTGSQNSINVSNATIEFFPSVSNQDFKIVTKTVGDASPTSAFYIQTSTKSIGLYTDTPAATLDVNGDTIIRGSLTVEGDLTAVNTTNIEIEDKLIELGKLVAPAVADNSTADGGGFSLEGGLDGDKTFTWQSSTSAWTSSENIDIASGKSYYINGLEVLNSTTLSTNITDAQGLRRLGTLDDVQVGLLDISDNIISYVGPLTIGNIVLTPKSVAGTVDVSSSKITSLADPADPTDAVNLQTLEATVKSAPLGLSADTTGLTNPDIASTIIQKIYPASYYQNNTECRIWCIDQNLAKLFTVAASTWTFSTDLP